MSDSHCLGTFAWEWRQWAPSRLVWATALEGQTKTRKMPNKKIYWFKNTVSPLRCPSSSTQSVESGQEPSHASIWSYCQTSSKPPLPLFPWHYKPSLRILPSPGCLPGCFSPSSLPGCPSLWARPPLLPAAGRPLVWRPGPCCHPLGAGHCQEPRPGTSPGMQGYTSRPPSSQQPCRTLRSSHIAGKKRKISKWSNSFT